MRFPVANRDFSEIPTRSFGADTPHKADCPGTKFRAAGTERRHSAGDSSGYSGQGGGSTKRGRNTPLSRKLSRVFWGSMPHEKPTAPKQVRTNREGTARLAAI